jgi:hypothetical protein
MVLKRVLSQPTQSRPAYSVRQGASKALNSLMAACHHQLPAEFINHLQNVVFTTPTASSDEVIFPCPLKEQEAAAAIKGLEACAAAAIADLRYGARPRTVEIDLAKTACFLMSAYITTIDGMTKASPDVKEKIPGI